MKLAKITPGPIIGYVLHALLEEVLDDPLKNDLNYLEKKTLELIALPIAELQKLGASGKDKLEEKEGEEIQEIRKRHWVS